MISYIYEATKDWQETFTIIDGFIDYIENHNTNEIIKQFKDELEEISQRNNICPKCGSEITAKEGKENYLSEAWGKDIYERETIKKCNNCGWKES